MNILLTGSNGLIGSRTKQILTDKGYNVVCIPHEEIKELTPDIINDINPSHIIHLAAYGNRSDQTDESEIFYANVGLTQLLLQVTKNHLYQSFINCSSSSVYGQKVNSMKEIMSLETDTLYGCSKVAAEYLCRAHAIQNNKPVVSVRPFTVFGPWDSYKKLIPTIIRSIKNNEPMILDPAPVHDYVYVDDFVDALIIIMENADKLKGQAINVGKGVDYSNLEIVRELEDIIGSKLTYEVTSSLRSYDTGCWRANNKKITELGWKPKFSLRQGLEQCI